MATIGCIRATSMHAAESQCVLFLHTRRAVSAITDHLPSTSRPQYVTEDVNRRVHEGWKRARHEPLDRTRPLFTEKLWFSGYIGQKCSPRGRRKAEYRSRDLLGVPYPHPLALGQRHLHARRSITTRALLPRRRGTVVGQRNPFA
jgi:hypothetical protein